jgi:hypothetical protein
VNAITGTYANGQIALDSPADWPEGCRVLIEPLPNESTSGLSEDDWSDSPEAIAEWLRWYDSLQPLEMTPPEEADLAAWRQQVKEHTLATMNRDIDGLFP